MSKHHKDPLVESLKEGKSYTWTAPDGGNFASMRKAIKHGQVITMSPVTDAAEVQVGDIVLVAWHQGYLFHMVGEIQGDRYLIVNSLGKENGWVSGKDILGRVTQLVDGEPRPSVPEMLEELKDIYLDLIESEKAYPEDAQRLLSIVDDLRWYASRLGPQRLDEMPRTNKWSFEQNLWRLLKQARKGAAPVPNCIDYFTDCGKECVGLASEIYALFEYSALEQD
ncbi:MAG: hypothetical protein WCC12_03480 [Anaerolineales bacterium]